MNKRTIKAIQRSITDKWIPIRDDGKIDDGWTDCPLCGMFFNYDNPDESCNGCPVKQKTGNHGCDGTPYEEWVNKHLEERNKIEDKKDSFLYEWTAHSPEFKKIAQKEIDFLNSLLPKEHQVG